MVIADIPMFFKAGDLNSIVFSLRKSEISVGIEKLTLYLAVRICLFNSFYTGQLNFMPLGMITFGYR